MLSLISANWAGEPLNSYETIGVKEAAKVRADSEDYPPWYSAGAEVTKPIQMMTFCHQIDDRIPALGKAGRRCVRMLN